MDQAINDFISSKRLAVVGVSHNQHKFGTAAYAELKKRGYQVFGVNPTLPEIAGDRCYKDLTSLKDQIDGAVVCVPPDKLEPILREASSIGLRNIWLQQGAESDEAMKVGCDLGLNLVSGKCILMYAEPVNGFHGFHRFFVRLTGRL